MIDRQLLSSGEFPESAKHTPFPIVLALYQKDTRGMAYNFIRSFRFRPDGKSDFCLGDFDYINNYIDKYPKKNRPVDVERDGHHSEKDAPLFFWTMRDINALKRNRTFVENYSANTIVIDKQKLDYYAYVDVFKRNLHRLPFYFGNCDVLIDDNLFRQYKPAFVSDAVRHHPFLKKRFQINSIEKQQAVSGLDMYFKLLLGEHHV